jgi:hypothetical protein
VGGEESDYTVRTSGRFIYAAVASALLTTASCRNTDVVTATYATLDEAQRAGAIERGWLPRGLPPGTRDIREAHDLDANRRWGLFSFPRDEATVLRQALQQQEVALSGQACDAPGRIEWWPVLLRGILDPEKIQAAGLQAYRSADGNLLFAVNWRQGRAYYWTPASAASR